MFESVVRECRHQHNLTPSAVLQSRQRLLTSSTTKATWERCIVHVVDKSGKMMTAFIGSGPVSGEHKREQLLLEPDHSVVYIRYASLQLDFTDC